MRVSTVFSSTAIAMLVVLGLAGQVSAGTVVYDDFSGTALDTTRWTVRATGSVTEADGILTEASYQDVQSTTGWSGAYTATIKLGPTAPVGGIFGISDMTQQSSNANSVLFGDGFWGGPGWVVEVNNKVYALAAAPMANDVYDIALNPTGVQIQRNGSLIIDAPVSDVGSMTQNLGFRFISINNGGSQSIDYAAITAVPEPATIVMLITSIIGLLAYSWRSRK